MVEKDFDEITNVRILRINNRYFRKMADSPDGSINHFGDCDFYSSLGICTCGLLKDLIILDHNIASKLYNDFEGDLYYHHKNIDKNI